MQYKAIIFDLFGTLIDLLPDEVYAENMLLMTSALQVPYSEFYQVWLEASYEHTVGLQGSLRGDIIEACKRIGYNPNTQQLDNAEEIRLTITKRNLTPRKDAIPTINQLKEKGYKIGLLSDAYSDVAHVWHQTPLAPLFDSAVFSCQVNTKKPDAKMYNTICSNLGVKAEECLYIGDGGSMELSGAIKAGLEPILIRVGYESHFDHLRHDAKGWGGKVISSLSEVLLSC